MPTTTVKNSIYRLEIKRMPEPDNTRDVENLGTMICFHSRYSLGDKHHYSDKDAFLFGLLGNQIGDAEKAERKYEELAEKIDQSVYRRSGAYNKAVDDEIIDFLKQKHIILPLFLYDHSGITINTKGFSCPWDSGQVGWIYVSHDKLNKEMGIHKITPEAIKRTEEILEAEVKEYDCYLRGECYGYRLYENGNEIDSCYGFVGEFDDVKKQIVEYLPEDAKELAEAAEYGEEIIDDEEEMVL